MAIRNINLFEMLITLRKNKAQL